jgi:hypothetical protein
LRMPPRLLDPGFGIFRLQDSNLLHPPVEAGNRSLFSSMMFRAFNYESHSQPPKFFGR